MFGATNFPRSIPVSGTTGFENPHRPLPETPRSSRSAGRRLRAIFAAAVLSICASSLPAQNFCNAGGLVSGPKMTALPLFTQDVCLLDHFLFQRSILLTKLDGRSYAFGREDTGEGYTRGDFNFLEYDAIVPADISSRTLSSATAADFDGDGKVEVLLSYFSGEKLVSTDGTVQENALPQGSLSGCGIVVAGDFNADGRTDAAAFCNGGFRTLLNEGRWKFRIVEDQHPAQNAAAGDFNGDGKDDLIVQDMSGALKVLLSDGTGRFRPATALPDGGAFDYRSMVPRRIAVGDFNNDGNLDAVIVYRELFHVWLGDGQGNLTLRHAGSFNFAPVAVVASDFNLDGNMDIAITGMFSAGNFNVSPIAVMIGDGAGNFQPEPHMYTQAYQGRGTFAIGMLLVDEGYHKRLIIMSDFHVEELLSTPTKPHAYIRTPPLTFSVRAGYPAPAPIPVRFTTNTTVTLTTDQSWLKAEISPDQLASGTTLRDLTISVSADSASVPAGDYSGNVGIVGDGKQLASVKVTFHVANPAGTLKPFKTLGGKDVVAVAAADLNRDGRQDLVVADHAGFVRVHLGTGNGAYVEVWNHGLPSSQITALTVGDFNNDKNPDFALVGYVNGNGAAPNYLSVWLGIGNGQFIDNVFNEAAATPGCTAGSMAAGDFNNDGKLDLLVQTNGSERSPVRFIHWGDGTGKFSGALKEDCTSATPRTFGNPTSMAVGDFNGDHNLDVISFGNGSGSGLMFGDGKGDFSRSSQPMPRGMELVNDIFPVDAYPAGFVTAGDLNADGILDAVVAFDAGIQVLLGRGNGAFTRKPAIAMAGQAYSTTLADWNGDGLTDIAVAGPNGVSVLLGDGKGEFAPSAFFHVPMNVNLPIQMAAADVNGDGRLDLMVPANGGTVLLGAPASTVAQLSTSSSATIASGQPLPVTLTLLATDSAFQSPSGAVTFYDGTKVLGTMTQTTSAYSFNALNLAPGVHQISAKYDGNARNVGSTSNVLTITIK